MYACIYLPLRFSLFLSFTFTKSLSPSLPPFRHPHPKNCSPHHPNPHQHAHPHPILIPTPIPTRVRQESNGNVERIRDVYERAIANVPPVAAKDAWRRYIYLWIQVFISMHFHMGCGMFRE